MKILLTNDDGIESEITRSLFDSLKEKHEVTLIAPEMDKSGQGAAITLRTSVEVNNAKAAAAPDWQPDNASKSAS